MAGAATGDEDLAERTVGESHTQNIAVVSGKLGHGHFICVGEDLYDWAVDGPQDQVDGVATAAKQDILGVVLIGAPGRVARTFCSVVDSPLG